MTSNHLAHRFSKKRRLSGLLFFGFNLLMLPSAYGSTWEGKVEEISVTLSSNVILFSLASPLEDSPRCNANKMYAIDTRLPNGRTAADLLRAAYANGRTVIAVGNNACTANFKSEEVKRLSFQ